MSFSITRNGITVEGDKMADVFKELAALQEVFSVDECGKCGSTDLRYVVREDSEENEYFELHCQDRNCRARFAFGQMKTPKGRLFPKRKDKEGKWLPDNGWTKWDKEKQKEV